VLTPALRQHVLLLRFQHREPAGFLPNSATGPDSRLSAGIAAVRAMIAPPLSCPSDRQAVVAAAPEPTAHPMLRPAKSLDRRCSILDPPAKEAFRSNVACARRPARGRRTKPLNRLSNRISAPAPRAFALGCPGKHARSPGFRVLWGEKVFTWGPADIGSPPPVSRGGPHRLRGRPRPSAPCAARQVWPAGGAEFHQPRRSPDARRRAVRHAAPGGRAPPAPCGRPPQPAGLVLKPVA